MDLQLLIISTETVMMEGEDFAEHLSCSLLPCRYKSWILEVKAFALDYAFIYRGGQNPGVLTPNYYFFLHGVLQMSKCPPKQFSAMLSYSSSNGSRLQKKKKKKKKILGFVFEYQNFNLEHKYKQLPLLFFIIIIIFLHPQVIWNCPDQG